MFTVALFLLLVFGSYGKCFQLTQPASVIVQPSQHLTIACQVSYSVSSYWTAWIRQPAGKGLEWIGIARAGQTTYYKDSLKNKFSISTDSSSNTVTLNGQNMQPQDTAVYYCAREPWIYAFGYWGKGTMVTVTSATVTAPEVFPLSPCSSGSANTFTLACLATGFSPSSLTFSWTKSDTALTDFIQFPAIQKGDHYTGISHIQVNKEDWDKRDSIKCLATNTAGNSQGSFSFPEVIYVSPTVKVCSSSDEESEVTFSCVAKDFSPKEYNITWLKNTEQITGKIDQVETVSPGRAGNKTTLYSAASFLTVDSNDWAKGITYTCVFTGKGKNQSDVIQKSVTFKETSVVSDGCSEADVEISIAGPTIESMSLDKKGTLTCEVKVNKGRVEKMYWENSSGKEIAGSQMVPDKRKQHTLVHFLDITYDEWINGAQVSCVVLHDNMIEPMKKEYKKLIGINTSKPTAFMLPPLVLNKQQMVTLTCFVKDFFPQELYVSWFINDEEASSEYEFNTTSPIESKGSYFAYSQLTLSLEQWNENDSVYSCVVYHESLIANTTRAIVRSIDYRSFEKNNVVNLNMNIK